MGCDCSRREIDSSPTTLRFIKFIFSFLSLVNYLVGASLLWWWKRLESDGLNEVNVIRKQEKEKNAIKDYSILQEIIQSA